MSRSYHKDPKHIGIKAITNPEGAFELLRRHASETRECDSHVKVDMKGGKKQGTRKREGEGGG